MILPEDLLKLSSGPARTRLLGFDLGEKTIGLALSDVDRRIATPHSTIARRKFTADAAAIRAIVDEFAVGGLVYGLPVNMDGSEGPRVQATRAFARNLARSVDLPFAFWDERLSTAAVTRAMIAADLSRRKRAVVVDQLAAAYILQGALDRMNRLSSGRAGDAGPT